MKRIAILLSILVLAAAIVIGVQVGQRNTLDREKTDALQKVTLLDKEKTDALQKVMLLQGDLDKSGQELTAAQTDLGEQQAAASSLQEEKAALSASLEAQQAAASALNAEKATLEAALAEKQAALDALTGETPKLQAYLEEKQAALDALIGEKTTLEASLAEKQAALDALAGEKTALDVTLAEKQAAFDVLAGEKSTLEAALAVKQTALDALTSEKTKLAATVAEQQTAMTALSREKVALDEAFAAAKADLEAATAQVTELTAEKDALTADIAAANLKLEEAGAQVASLTSTLKTTEEQRSSLEIENVTLQTKVDQLNSELEKVAKLAEATATPTAAPTATLTVKPTATPTVKPTAVAVVTEAPVVAAVATEAPVVAAVVTEVPVVAAVVAEAPTAAPEAIASGEKTQVAIWHTFTEDQEVYLVKAVADFNASQDKVEVKALSQPYQGFAEAVKSAVTEGIGPDIIFNYASEAAGYVKAGLVADLSQYIYDASMGIEGFDGSLAKGIMDGEVNGFEDGLIHYLPAYTTGPILFYNKTLFEELKIAVPTTWEEFEAAAKIIKEQKNIPALGFDALTDLVQMLIMETPGAGYIDVANKAVLFDTPEVRARIQWLVDMVKQGYFLLQPSGDYFSSDFNSGIIASYFGSCAGYPYIEPKDFEFAMAPVPADTWYPSWNRGPIVFYYKDDARAQAAYEFVKYFISADVNAGWVQAVTALAPYSWTKDTDAYKAFIAQDTLAVQSLKAVEANLDVAGSLPAVDGANIVRTALQDAVKKAALGELTVDQAWDEAVKVSNAALKGE